MGKLHKRREGDTPAWLGFVSVCPRLYPRQREHLASLMRPGDKVIHWRDRLPFRAIEITCLTYAELTHRHCISLAIASSTLFYHLKHKARV